MELAAPLAGTGPRAGDRRRDRRTRRASASRRTSRSPGSWPRSTGTRLDALNRWFFRTRFAPSIADPIIAGGFWSIGGAEALRAIAGSRSCPGWPRTRARRSSSTASSTCRSGCRAATSARRAERRSRVRLAGATHLSNLDRPAAFTEAVRRFAPLAAASRLTRDPPSARSAADRAAGTPRYTAADPPNPAHRPRFDARSQGRLPCRGLGHPLPPRHQGAAERDAAAGRQADHPVRGRGGRRRRDRAGHHRHLQPEAGDRGPLRPLLRARAPARGEGRHRDAPPGPPHQRPGPGGLRPPEGAAGPRARGADGQGPHRPRAVRGDPARRRGHRRPTVHRPAHPRLHADPQLGRRGHGGPATRRPRGTASSPRSRRRTRSTTGGSIR